MSKIAIQYTDDNGVVFSIEAENDKFKAGRSDLNGGRLINIPDMKENEAWQLNPKEQKVLSGVMHVGTAIGAFDPIAANRTDSINNRKMGTFKQEKDEDFI